MSLYCETPALPFTTQVLALALILIALGTFARVAYLFILFYSDEETHLAVRKYSIYSALELLGSLVLFLVVSFCA